MTLAHLETPDALRPAIYVGERDKRLASEIVRQQEVIAYLRRYAKGIVVFAVPNSARTAGEKMRQYREGAMYGAADLVCVWEGGVAFIEMKAATTMPRANQVAFLNRLHALGHHVAVCRSVEQAVGFLVRCGAPVPAMR